jgi:hypothetical protein
VARLLVARGLIESVEVEHLRPEAVKKIHPYALVMWGTNHRARAQKLRAVGWMPAGPLKEKTVEEMVDAVLEARNDN